MTVRAACAWLGLAVLAPVVPAADWHALAPAEFARLPEVEARIDVAEFDSALMAAAIFHETNRVRRDLGLAALAHLAKLDAAADLKASVGIFEPELTHTSRLPFTATPAERVASVGLNYHRVAENIARLPSYDLPAGMNKLGIRDRHGRTGFYRLDTGEDVRAHTYRGFAAFIVEAWLKSPGHRANIVSTQLTHLGCAARPCTSLVTRHEQIYAVQVFFTPMPPR